MEYLVSESALCEGATSQPKPHIGIVLLAAGTSSRMGRPKQLIPWRGKTVLEAVCHALVRGYDRAETYPCIEGAPFVAVTACVTAVDGNVVEFDTPKTSVEFNTSETPVPLDTSETPVSLAGDCLSGESWQARIDHIAQSYGFSVVHNEQPERGQGSSIAIGVKAAIESHHFMPLDGIICSVADQPLLEPIVVEELITTFQQALHELKPDEVHKTIIVPHYGAGFHPGNPVLFGSYWFSALQHIDGDQGGKTIIRGEGKQYVRQLWISSDIGDDIDTPEDLERLRRREREVL